MVIEGTFFSGSRLIVAEEPDLGGFKIYYCIYKVNQSEIHRNRKYNAPTPVSGGDGVRGEWDVSNTVLPVPGPEKITAPFFNIGRSPVMGGVNR